MIRTTLVLAVLLSLGPMSLGNSGGQLALGTTIPFTENFIADSADWYDAASTPLNFVPSGGIADSGYASTNFAFSAGGGGSGNETAVLFRAQDEFGTGGSSGNAFAGDWISSGVGLLTAQVRHNGPIPLNYFLRGSGPFNFPGATAIQFVPVPPGVWTEIEFIISPLNPQFVSFEGSDFATVFSDIGHLQFGVSIPASLGADPTPYTFDIDQVTIAAPEPTTGLLVGLVLLGCGLTVRPTKQ